jgi:hypothetical protein
MITLKIIKILISPIFVVFLILFLTINYIKRAFFNLNISFITAQNLVFLFYKVLPKFLDIPGFLSAIFLKFTDPSSYKFLGPTGLGFAVFNSSRILFKEQNDIRYRIMVPLFIGLTFFFLFKLYFIKSYLLTLLRATLLCYHLSRKIKVKTLINVILLRTKWSFELEPEVSLWV